jgi:hypothetical protein
MRGLPPAVLAGAGVLKTAATFVALHLNLKNVNM